MALPAGKDYEVVTASVVEPHIVQPIPVTANNIVQVPVVLPPGVVSGQTLNISYNGRTYQMVCPQGALPGQTVTAQVNVDPSPPPTNVQANVVIQSNVNSNVVAQSNVNSVNKINSARTFAIALITITVVNFLFAWASLLGTISLGIAMILNLIAGYLVLANAKTNLGNVNMSSLGPAFGCGIVGAIFACAGIGLCFFEAAFPIYCLVYYVNDPDDFNPSGICAAVPIINVIGGVLAIFQLIFNIAFLVRLNDLRSSLQVVIG